MHIVHLIRQRFPARWRIIVAIIALLSAAALLAGIGVLVSMSQ
jgi:hypothetical protein